jgi:lipid-binding SYLF domain-containing protein
MRVSSPFRPTATLLLGLLAGCATEPPPTAEGVTSQQQRLVQRAEIVLHGFRNQPIWDEMPEVMRSAYGVVVIPQALKAGLFVGGQYGNGVMVVRNPDTGEWGNPVFVDLYGGSLGFQIGAQSTDIVIALMNEAAVERVMTEGVKLGADVGLAFGQLGAGVGASTTTNFGQDAFVFAKGQGLYGGMTVEGAYLRSRDDWNDAFYGRSVVASEVAREAPAQMPGLSGMRGALYGFERPSA